jgi:hypothetical protein
MMSRLSSTVGRSSLRSSVLVARRAVPLMRLSTKYARSTRWASESGSTGGGWRRALVALVVPCARADPLAPNTNSNKISERNLANLIQEVSSERHPAYLKQ